MSKQWYDTNPDNFAYIIKAKKGDAKFKYSSDFDENGIVYWIGTNEK